MFFIVLREKSSESFGDLSCITNGKLHLHINNLVCGKKYKRMRIN